MMRIQPPKMLAWTRLAVVLGVGVGLSFLGGCYYRYPYKVKKKPSSCPYKRPAKKAKR